jgi:DNA-binding beta-propeller fold protein YncE
MKTPELKFIALVAIATMALAACQSNSADPFSDAGNTSSVPSSAEATKDEAEQNPGAETPPTGDIGAPVGTFRGTFQVGGESGAIATSRNGSKLFVTRTRGNSEEILSVDAETLEIYSATGNVLPNPRRQSLDGLAVSADGSTIYSLASESRAALILVIDPLTGRVLQQAKLRDNYGGLFRLGSNLYTSSWNYLAEPRLEPHRLAQIKTENVKSIREIEVGYANIVGTCSSSDEIALVSEEEDGREGDIIFMPIKVSAFQVRDLVEVGSEETVLAIDPSCTTLMKEPFIEDALLSHDIKLATDKALAVEKYPQPFERRLIAYSPDGSLVYVLIERGSTYGLAIVDAQTLEIKGEIMADASGTTNEARAEELVLSGDGSRAFLLVLGNESREDSDSVLVFDLIGG